MKIETGDSRLLTSADSTLSWPQPVHGLLLGVGRAHAEELGVRGARAEHGRRAGYPRKKEFRAGISERIG